MVGSNSIRRFITAAITVAAVTVVMLRETKPPAPMTVNEARREPVPAPPFVAPEAAPSRQQLAVPARKKAAKFNTPMDSQLKQSLGAGSGSNERCPPLTLV